MNNRHRIGILVATAVALVAAFVVLAPDDDEDEVSSSTTPTVVTPAEPPATTEAPATTTAAPEPEPEPEFTTIRVRGGQPVGGVEKLEVTTGERVRLQVTTPDTSDEVHLHGYDISKDLAPGRRARFSFEADAEGIFEVELEGSHVQIAELEVRPG